MPCWETSIAITCYVLFNKVFNYSQLRVAEWLVNSHCYLVRSALMIGSRSRFKIDYKHFCS